MAYPAAALKEVLEHLHKDDVVTFDLGDNQVLEFEVKTARLFCEELSEFLKDSPDEPFQFASIVIITEGDDYRILCKNISTKVSNTALQNAIRDMRKVLKIAL